ncbi:MAG: DNA mismatch repair endonuclease MutL [Oscillospiraceae bacterium]|nr:DNA mismatch repair endonuclease MutL [Oscillospiraceae bacterium]
MPKIKELSRVLADMIAAGEVVERPASAVKELCENALDAGATVITVEIKGGGLTFLRVTDNGSGIERDDVPRAFLRHATSKIRDISGLESIATLGFRGEALAAISSVSRVELLTRSDTEDEGTRARLTGGVITDISPAARPAGTTVTVLDLFFNTPARQKFMKTDRAEAGAVLAAVTRIALSRPDVSVRYIRDGAEELHTPGDGRAESCVYSVLGREFISGALPVEYDGDGVRTHGFVSKVSALRGSRTGQYFFVNGRAVRSATLQAALEQAYRNRMFTGRFPACALYIETGFSKLDVNVHPAKTEIKFLFEKQIFDGVYYGALSALDSDGAIPASGGQLTPNRREPEETIPTGQSAVITPPKSGYGGGFAPRKSDIARPRGFSDAASLPVRDRNSVAYNAGVDIIVYDEPRPRQKPAAPAEPEYAEKIADETPLPPFRVVGEAMNTYIIAEAGERLVLIDKHAAHERIHFDALSRGAWTPMPQVLLSPIVITAEADAIAALLERAELLRGLGFELEAFGSGSVAVRQLPSELDLDQAESVLSDIARELILGGRDLSRRRDEMYAAIACKTAIKAGRSSQPSELYALAARVLSGEVQYCPHGRPVAFEITKTFLDRGFKRIS